MCSLSDDNDLQWESVSNYDRGILRILFGIVMQISGRLVLGSMRHSLRDVEEGSCWGSQFCAEKQHQRRSELSYSTQDVRHCKKKPSLDVSASGRVIRSEGLRGSVMGSHQSLAVSANQQGEQVFEQKRSALAFAPLRFALREVLAAAAHLHTFARIRHTASIRNRLTSRSCSRRSPIRFTPRLLCFRFFQFAALHRLRPAQRLHLGCRTHRLCPRPRGHRSIPITSTASRVNR